MVHVPATTAWQLHRRRVDTYLKHGYFIDDDQLARLRDLDLPGCRLRPRPISGG